MAYTIAKAIAASAALLLVWIVVAATVFGLGRLTQWLLGFSHHHRVGARLTFWLGVSLACTILLGWNFLAPINGVASSTLLLVGIGACWKGRNDLASSCRSALTALGRTGLAVCIVFGFWLANHARGALTYLDSANYHIQAVRWAENFAVVPGLANLHSRLGYQSAAFLYYAAVDTGPFRGHAQNVANGFLLFLLGVGALVSIFGYSRAAGRFLLGTAVDAVALALAVSWIARGETVSSFATNVPATAVGFAMASAFVGLFNDDWASRRVSQTVSVGYLATAAVALKLSLAPLSAAIVLVSVWRLWAQSTPIFGRRRHLALGATLVLVTGGFVVARSVVTSGYPLYPASIFPFPVDWRVPAEQAKADAVFVRTTGKRITHIVGVVPEPENLGNWLPGWLYTARLTLFNVAVPAAIFVFGIAATFLLKFKPASPGPPWLALAPFAVAALSWWLASPMSRFGVVPLWSLAAWAATRLLQRLSISDVRWSLGIPAVLALLFAPLLSLQDPARWELRREFTQGLFGRIRGDHWVDSSNYAPNITVYITHTGVPLNTPSGLDGQCWDAPLPCTPTPAKNLELRDPAWLGAGFRVNGSWQAEGWPEHWLPQFRSGALGLR